MRYGTAVLFVMGCLLVPPPAPINAAELDFGIDYRIRGFSTQNLSDADSAQDDDTSYASSRFLLTAKAAHENLHAIVTLILGQDSNTGNRLLGSDSYGPTDGNGTNFFGLLEAYIQADLAAGGLSAGRRGLILGHSLIYDDPADSIRGWSRVGPIQVTLAAAKVAENTYDSDLGGPAVGNNTDPTIGTTSDADLYLIDAAGGEPERLRLNLFVAHLNDRGPNLYLNDPADTQLALTTVGLAGNGMLGPIQYTGEMDFLTGSISNQTGIEPRLQGFNVVLEAAADAGPARVKLTGIYASGQDPDEDPLSGGDLNVNGIDGNYATGIIITNGGARSLAPKDGTCLSINGDSLGGVPNCIGGSGLTAAKLSGSIPVLRKAVLDAAAIWAQSSQENASGNKNIGVELDGTAKYLFREDFHFLAGVGYLVAGDFFGSDPDNLLVLVGELAFKFE